MASREKGVEVLVDATLRGLIPEAIAGVGVDAVEVSDFARDLDLVGDELRNSVFSQAELAECAGDVERLAGRFAAKEAVLKALGTGIRGIELSDVEIVTEPSGKPSVVLSIAARRLANRRGVDRVLCSMTHEADLALAVAVAIAHSRSSANGEDTH